MKDSKPKIPPTFLSSAYLKEIENGTYSLFRDMLVEGKENGKVIREKIGKPIPVGKLLREAAKGEENLVVVKAFHPGTLREMQLVEIQPQENNSK